MITKRTWAIAGVAAALILVPASASYAVVTATDNPPPTATERVQLRQDHQANYGGTVGGMFGTGYGDQTQNQNRDQVRDPAQNPSGDYTRDQVRDQLRDQVRDTENCDGDGPIGDGPRAGDNSGRGGMMGGRGSGR